MATSTPKPSALEKLMAQRGLEELPEAQWTNADDIGRLSIESFVAQQHGDAREVRSAGRLRLYGVMVEDHRADLDDVSRIGMAWQRALKRGRGRDGGSEEHHRAPCD